jgi:hypothetical protein
MKEKTKEEPEIKAKSTKPPDSKEPKALDRSKLGKHVTALGKQGKHVTALGNQCKHVTAQGKATRDCSR